MITLPENDTPTLPWQREIPVVIGVIGDFSGTSTMPLPPLPERDFVEVDIDTIDSVLAGFRATLPLSVEDTVAGDGRRLVMLLPFSSLTDFSPDAIIRHVPVLSSLSQRRAVLRARLVAAEEDLAADTLTLAQLSAAIDDLDLRLSGQMDAILHDPAFRQLEGRWRGLAWLVRHVETSHHLQLRVLNASRQDIARDMRRAVAVEQTALFRKLHDAACGVAGGIPFAVVICDEEWGTSEEDAAILRAVSAVAEFCGTPFVSGGSPTMFGCPDWAAAAGLVDLEAAHAAGATRQWESLRDCPTSRQISLMIPRLLARSRYGVFGDQVTAFAYGEAADGLPWINGAYAVGSRIAAAFQRHGDPAMMLQSPSDGVIADVPLAESDVGTLIGPTECHVTEYQALALRRLGVLPIHCLPGTLDAAFFETTTLHRLRPDGDPATAHLPCQLTVGRFAHYLKRIAYGACVPSSIVPILKAWIAGYVQAGTGLDHEEAMRHPLHSARIAVEDDWIVAWLCPRMVIDEVRVRIRPVSRPVSRQM